MNAEKIKFRTEVSIDKFPFIINHKSTILLAGSCFADMIGAKMKFNKFNCLSNPFGNIYNPHSLFSLLKHSLENTLPEEDFYLENQGRWFNYHYHSEISGIDKNELKSKILSINETVAGFFKKTDYVILTLGTAFVYKLIENNSIVANCHKSPLKYFKKELLSPKEIIDDYNQLHQYLVSVNPDIKIIFTVSPVRHIKDTLPLNAVSKSILRTSIHYILESYSNTFYFPSYEIMLDDLRDYRFYKDDLIHPSTLAEDIIWEKFCSSSFDKETLDFISEWEKVSRAINHKAFHPESLEHQTFLKNTFIKLEALNKRADFAEEMRLLTERIVK